MDATSDARLDTLADESLVAAFAYLPPEPIVAVSAASTRYLPVARVDVLWLPLASRRWRFGAVPTNKEALLPGAREMASESALAEAAQFPLRRQACVFDFFAGRCRQDMEVALLTLQFQQALLHQSAAAEPSDAEDRRPGAVVRLSGLKSAPQYNGAVGVLGEPIPGGQRFKVALPTSKNPISVGGQNLQFCRPPVAAEEAERRVLEAGAAGIDSLVRQGNVLGQGPEPAPATQALAVRYLLTRAMQEWCEQQWRLLLADRDRTDLLEEGGLIVSQWAEPGNVDVAAVRSRLAELASAVEARTSAGAPIMERVEAVSAVLFDEWGFSGDKENYYNPQNSLLHAVLARRRGIPISLSIVWVAVARRVSVPCFLLANMPSHVLIRVTTGGGGLRDDIFVDAFHQKVMDFSKFMQFVASITGRFSEEFAVQRPATAVYERLLRNLRNIFQEKTQTPQGDQLEAFSALQSLGGVCSQMLAIAEPSADNPEAEQVRAMRDSVRQASWKYLTRLRPAR
mmetsp:Transcript_20085/g.40776  ORF Transcript_20085/g.40776 Transcript_20085/m.40776 type:complete len:512 (+) Transcript_20085:2-1537(+)